MRTHKLSNIYLFVPNCVRYNVIFVANIAWHLIVFLVVTVPVLSKVDNTIGVAVQMRERAVNVAAQLLVSVVVVFSGCVLVDCSFTCKCVCGCLRIAGLVYVK